VEACLEELDAGVGDQIHHPVLLRETPGPTSGQRMLQGFRFSNSLEGIAVCRFDQTERVKCDFSIRFDPEDQIGEKFAMEE
jgi:hypothetical protein